LIQETVPVEQIIITNSEKPDAHLETSSLEDVNDMPLKQWFTDLIKVQMNKGLTKKEAIEVVMTIEPFYYYPELISLIEGSI